MFDKPKSEGPVNVKFTCSSFRYKGVEYNSAVVEKAAEEGNEQALELVANLVKIGSGIVSVSEDSFNEESIEEAHESKPSSKRSKAPKSVKPNIEEKGDHINE